MSRPTDGRASAGASRPTAAASPEGDAAAAVVSVAFPAVPGLAASRLPRALTALGAPDVPWDLPRGARASAVLMLFVPGGDAAAPASLVLTRRSITMRSHRGQIGFAGGRAEAGDDGPAATAVRETEEELGIPRGDVGVVGLLPSLVGRDGSRIVPVVAVAAVERGALRPSAAEVAEVLLEPWTTFADGRAHRFDFNLFGRWRRSFLYPIASGSVWGLTAQIIADARLTP
jgi:8-oxo-dGTP pyrophosphatase MutT (NUDIX family)